MPMLSTTQTQPDSRARCAPRMAACLRRRAVYGTVAGCHSSGPSRVSPPDGPQPLALTRARARTPLPRPRYRQPVRGDACLFVQDACPSELERLLSGRPPRRPRAASAPAPLAGVGPAGAAAESPGSCSAACTITTAAAPADAAACKRQHLERLAAAPPAAAPPPAAAAASAVPWSDLPPHVIGSIALGVGTKVSQVLPLFGTCRCVAGPSQMCRGQVGKIKIAGARRFLRPPPPPLRCPRPSRRQPVHCPLASPAPPPLKLAW
jgi:hypothetical protein